MIKIVRRLENRGRTDNGIISSISDAYENFNNHWGSTAYDNDWYSRCCSRY